MTDDGTRHTTADVPGVRETDGPYTETKHGLHEMGGPTFPTRGTDHDGITGTVWSRFVVSLSVGGQGGPDGGEVGVTVDTRRDGSGPVDVVSVQTQVRVRAPGHM